MSVTGKACKLRQLGLQRSDRDAQVQQWLPEGWQAGQGLTHFLLFGGRADQLVERQVALELFQADQLIQPLVEGGLALEQLD